MLNVCWNKHLIQIKQNTDQGILREVSYPFLSRLLASFVDSTDLAAVAVWLLIVAVFYVYRTSYKVIHFLTV